MRFFFLSFACQGGGCHARVVMKLCHKFKSPQIAIEYFQTLDEVKKLLLIVQWMIMHVTHLQLLNLL